MLKLSIPEFGPQLRKILLSFTLLISIIWGVMMVIGSAGQDSPEEAVEVEVEAVEFEEVVVTVGVGVGVVVGVAVGVGVDVGVGVAVGVGVGATEQVVFMVSVVVDTVVAKAKARPCQFTVLPMVIPESSISVPMKVEFAPRVVAAVGAQKISQEEAPLSKVTTELATVVRAPLILKI